MSRISDIWEPVIGKNGKVKFKPRHTIRGRKVTYAWCSRRKLYLKTKEGVDVTLNIRSYEGNSSCPKCGKVGGSVIRYKVDKSLGDPIFFIADLKCPKCNMTYNLRVNIYGYEKIHL